MSGMMPNRRRTELLEIEQRLRLERDRVLKLLQPMPVYADRTNQLEAALKSIDVASGLVNTVALEEPKRVRRQREP